MTHRERVLAALDHQEPDRVPTDLGGCLASGIVESGYPALRTQLGLSPKPGKDAWTFGSLTVIDSEVRSALDVDIVHAPLVFGGSDTVKTLSPDTFVDQWSVRWHKPEQGHYYVEHAPFEMLATPQAVDAHPWPQAGNLLRLERLVETLRQLRTTTDYAISLELQGRVMSMGQFLRGFENWMMDLADNESFVEALLARTTQIQLDANDVLLRSVGDLVDIVYTADDLGGQNSPLLSPASFKRLLRPHFEKLWGHIHTNTCARLLHHSCGSVYPFIPDFIDLGVQALNPIQVSAANMDPGKLKPEFGKHLTFWGGVDTRDVLPWGTVADVRNEVELRIRQMAKGGGFILAAVHNIQPEVPAANIVAMFQAAREFGRYT